MSRPAHQLSSNAWTKARTQESVAVVARHLRCAAPIKRIRRPLQRAIAQRFSALASKSQVYNAPERRVWVNRPSFVSLRLYQRKKVMKKFGINVALVALLVGVAGFSTPSRAETGQVTVVFTKGGFIVGVGGGEGVLTFRGKHYPFTASGMSVGFTIGASTTKLVGRALNLKGPASIEGTYSAIGAGGAVAAGAGAFNCRMPMA